MSVLPGLVRRSRWGHARQVASDLLIATALIWTLPLLFGVVVAGLAFLFPGR